MGIVKYNYGDMPIAFSGSDDVMINATEMAKAFGKKPVDWLRLPSTKEFMDALSEVRKSHFTNLIVTRRGQFADGCDQGTWFHEDIAIEFARWLSPKFAIWCNDIIKRILKERIEEQNRQIESMETALIPIARKSLSIGAFAGIISTYSGSNIGRTKLFDLLRELGYIQKNDRRPYQKYIDNKFFILKHKDGRPVTLVTPKGQKYIIKRVAKVIPFKRSVSLPLF